MKNLFKTGLIAAVSLISSVSFANDGFIVKISNEKEKTIRFYINEAKDLDLTIYSKDRNIIFEEKMHTLLGTTKTYDLNTLPDGEYTLKVESELEVANYAIVIMSNKALLSKPVVTTIFKPTIVRTNKIVSVDLSNSDNAPIEVQIFNENNEELYAHTFENTLTMTKKFNVDKTYGSTLIFVVKCKDQRFVKSISAY